MIPTFRDSMLQNAADGFAEGIQICEEKLREINHDIEELEEFLRSQPVGVMGKSFSIAIESDPSVHETLSWHRENSEYRIHYGSRNGTRPFLECSNTIKFKHFQRLPELVIQIVQELAKDRTVKNA